jgi:3-hydroxyacyl-CoA dehydrogenase / enoyl-CoA hydratase / 3-hydroxybutyryl-CoA epimerase
MAIENYLTLEKQENILIVWLDQRGGKINKVSPAMIATFAHVLDVAEQDNEVLAVVLISRKKDFVAGADIEAFESMLPGDAAKIGREGHSLLNRLEKSKKPFVAAIHGACMGAGLEIALACHGRISTQSPKTVMALPEVKLGLLPGGGGTQRLPKLIGLKDGLDMMLTGKNVYAIPAYKLGLVDKLIFPEALLHAAKIFALQLASKRFKRKDKRKGPFKILELTSAGRSLMLNKARKSVIQQTQGNYPAPLYILKCVETGYSKGRQAGFDLEIELFDKLVQSPESKQLIHLFFASTEMKKNPYSSLVKPLNTLGMIGSGLMGTGITEVSAPKGINVLLKDINPTNLAFAKKSIWKSLEKKLKQKSLGKLDAGIIINRVSTQTDYRDFKQADIVIEAVFEDITVKQNLIKELEKHLKPNCIIASNTSALPITKISEASKRPEQVIGMHYFSPVQKMPLLEIVCTNKTADWVKATCYELGLRQGKTCIVVKDGPGFYTTRILAVFLNEALLVLEEGADILWLDKTMREFGFPVGPITLMDEVGLDVGAHVTTGELMRFFEQRGAKGSTLLLRLSELGYKGRKAKKGFYSYDSHSGKKLAGKVNEEIYSLMGIKKPVPMDKELIQLRLALIMMNEAAYCLQEGIVSSPRDGDIGAVFGLGFPPFLGGPFRYADTLGMDELIRLLEKFSNQHGSRFNPAPVLSTMQLEGSKFYK